MTEQKKQELFLKPIVFDKIFTGFDYIETVNKRKFIKAPTYGFINKQDGFIIGSLYKYSGIYTKPSEPAYPYFDDFVPGELKERKRVYFLEVVTGMNKKFIVPYQNI